MTGWKDLNAEPLPAPMRARWETFRETTPDGDVFPGLAILAAFPPVITAHLLGGLAQNFIPGAKDIPALVARFLLSPLCRPLGRGLYEIYPDIQETLRSGITDPALEVRLAHFLDVYRQECAAEIPGPAMREALRWAAITILDPKTAAEEYLAAYNENRTSDLERMDAWQSRTVKPGKGAANPYQAAVQLVRGARSFESGRRENALLEQLRELAPLLRAEEGGARIKTKVPEELWRHLQRDEPATPNPDVEKQVLLVKVHILVGEVKDINKVMFSGFGLLGSFSERAFNTAQQTLIGEDANFFVNFWQADANRAPGILDSLWITQNGIYFVAIDYHPFLSDPNSKEAADLLRLIQRFQIRLPKESRIYVTLGCTVDLIPDERTISELASLFPQVEKFLPVLLVGSWIDSLRELIVEETAKGAFGTIHSGINNLETLSNIKAGILPARELAAKAGLKLSDDDPNSAAGQFIESASKTGSVIPEKPLFKQWNEETLLVTEPDIFLQDLASVFLPSEPWKAGPALQDPKKLPGYHNPGVTALILETYCLAYPVNDNEIQIPWRTALEAFNPIINRQKEEVHYLIFSLNSFPNEFLFQVSTWIRGRYPHADFTFSRSGFTIDFSMGLSYLDRLIQHDSLAEAIQEMLTLADQKKLTRQQNILFNLSGQYHSNERHHKEGTMSDDFYQRTRTRIRNSLKEILKEVFNFDEGEENLKIESNVYPVYKTIEFGFAGSAVAEEINHWKTLLDDFYRHFFPGLTYTLTERRIPAHATPEMITVEAGTFQMGDIMNDNEYNSEKPVHEVALDTFAIGKYPVTMEEYDTFCAATGREKPKDQGWGRGNRPVINVNWFDAVEYCNWLSELWGLEPAYRITKPSKSSDPLVIFNRMTNLPAGKAGGYRLPTEAEWEFAARAISPSLEGGRGEVSPSGAQGGGKVRFGNGKDIADPKEINFNASKDYKKPYSITGEYRGRTTPVDQFPPNPLGLHDMSGNVWEWCWDWFGTYPSEPQTNPTGPDSGSSRVYRGGSWNYNPANVRCANRRSIGPGFRDDALGFRLARTVTS